MDSHPDSPGPAPASQDFEIVPGRPRRDGWTPERQRAFIAELRASRCIDRAARAVGLSRESAYRLRRRPGAESFAAAWNAAMAHAPSRGHYNPDLWWHRALYGKIKPIVRGGRVVGELHTMDNQAAMRLLRRLDRTVEARSGAKGHDEKHPYFGGTL